MKDINLSEEKSRYWGQIVSHKYQFDMQEQELEMLSQITKQDFINLFEKSFFSKTSKRIDLQLTSELHRNEQEEYRKKNMKHDVFNRNIMKRVKVDGSITDFKRKSGSHPDFYK